MLDIERLIELDLSTNVDRVVDKIIEHNFDIRAFTGLDARIGLPQAPNIFEWLIDPRFCGQENFQPWPKQIYVLGSIFEEVCPMPTCTDRRFFETMFDQSLDEILDRITFLKFGVCPKCGATKFELYQEGLVTLVDDVSLCLGQRSSKTSMIAGFAGTYVLHRMLGIPDISKWFGLKPNQKIYGTLVAQTKDQAIKYPWADFYQTYQGSRWFQEYNSALTAISKAEGWDVDPVKMRDTFVEYRHKQVYFGAEGPNKRTLRGATRFFGGIDEFGWFSQDDSRETASADETMDALKNALRTLRSATRNRVEKKGWVNPVSIMCAKTSSPSHVGDPILSAIQAGRTLSKSFVLHAATWEFNPTVPQSDLREEFAQDYDKAMRSYGAVPPLAQAPFHVRSAEFFEALSLDRPQLFRHKIETYTDKTGIQYLMPKLGFLPKDDGIPRVLSVDPGSTNNSFAITLAHLEPDSSPHLDAIVHIEPRKDERGSILRVHFQKTLENCILPLLGHYNVVAVVYDRWQSISHIQQIRDFKPFADRCVEIQKANPKMVEGRSKIPTIAGAYEQTLRFADFQNFDGRLSEVRVPKLERPFSSVRDNLEAALFEAPVLSLLFQMATVRVSGTKVIKPAQGDDDIYRAFVNGVIYMVDPDRISLFTDHKGTRLSRTRVGGTRWVMKRGGDVATSAGSRSSGVGVTASVSQSMFKR